MATDRAWQVVEVALGIANSIAPYAGSEAATVASVAQVGFNALKARRDRAAQDMREALYAASTKSGRVLEELAQDEDFITFLVHAADISLRNNRREKLDSLKVAIANAACGHFTVEERISFLRYLDELSSDHFQVLAWLDDNDHLLKDRNELQQVYIALAQAGALVERGWFRTVIRDLDGRSLILLGDVEDYAEMEAHRNDHLIGNSNNDVRIIVTSTGTNLLQFIREA